MRRPLLAAAALAAVVLGGLVLLAWRGSLGREDSAVRFGVLADHPIAKLPPGAEACQRPVDLDRAAPILGLALESGRSPGPPLRVQVRALEGGRVLRAVDVPAGWEMHVPGFLPLELPSPIPAGAAVEVCARNDAGPGGHVIELVGKSAVAASSATVDDELIEDDWALFFPLPEDEKRSHLAMVPDMLERASVMRPGFVTPAFWVVLGLLLVAGAPLLLWRALVLADAEDEGRADRSGR